MTTENKNKIDKQLVLIKNVSVLLQTMLKPIGQHMRDFNCDENEAIQRKEKAYDFLKKYGVKYLEEAQQTIKQIANEEYNDINNIANNIIEIGNKL